jgi:hypothetical protein
MKTAIPLLLALSALACDPTDPVGADAGVAFDAGMRADAGSAPDAGEPVNPCDPERLHEDPNHCGVCGNVCGFFGAEALCIDSECAMGDCRAGFVDLNEDPIDGCEYECTVTDPLDPIDAEGIDANCDGMDGVRSRMIFVAEDGSLGGAGTPDDPLATIAGGLAMVDIDAGRSALIVAAGSYSLADVERIPAGVSLIGGFDRTLWRSTADQLSDLGEHPTRLVIEGGSGVVIEGISYSVTDASEGTIESVAVQLLDGDGVTIRRVELRSGVGGVGTAGSAGTSGADGAPGTGGGHGCEDSSGLCGGCSRPGGGVGGNSSCGMSGGAGGRPGHEDTGGDSGSPGIGGAEGGSGGSREEAGRPGTAGTVGDSGSPGFSGGGLGSFDGAEYLPANGGLGGIGALGMGGGGGGGGGGGDNICDSFGGAGGGGGGGGCPGTGGGGGSGGGASTALLVLSGSPTLQNSLFETAGGGDGGAAGSGGVGGDGGIGGPGGNREDDSGAGGRGGDGGGGGLGGSGGGGGGGASVGVWQIAGGTVQATGCRFNLGPGGAGGHSLAPGLDGEQHPTVPDRGQ